MSWRYIDPRGVKIKKCPFCGGGEQHASAIAWTGYNHTYVKCSYCDAKTRRFKNPEDAIDAWNRRVPE